MLPNTHCWSLFPFLWTYLIGNRCPAWREHFVTATSYYNVLLTENSLNTECFLSKIISPTALTIYTARCLGDLLSNHRGFTASWIVFANYTLKVSFLIWSLLWFPFSLSQWTIFNTYFIARWYCCKAKYKTCSCLQQTCGFVMWYHSHPTCLTGTIKWEKYVKFKNWVS